MSKTKTAVEWLVDELQREEWIPKEDSGVVIEYLISASKEMEKEHIDKSYHEGYQDGHEASVFNSIDIYNKIFKTKKNEQD